MRSRLKRRVRVAIEVARGIWKDGHHYSKAGVIAAKLVTAGSGQQALFAPGEASRDRPMQAMDLVNARMGRGTIAPLGLGFGRVGRRGSSGARRII